MALTKKQKTDLAELDGQGAALLANSLGMGPLGLSRLKKIVSRMSLEIRKEGNKAFAAKNSAFRQSKEGKAAAREALGACCQQMGSLRATGAPGKAEALGDLAWGDDGCSVKAAGGGKAGGVEAEILMHHGPGFQTRARTEGLFKTGFSQEVESGRWTGLCRCSCGEFEAGGHPCLHLKVLAARAHRQHFSWRENMELLEDVADMAASGIGPRRGGL